MLRITEMRYRLFAGILLTFLLIAAIYRASTFAISMDEAYTYLSFVAPPVKQVLTTYSPNHNVLYSLLAKASTTVLGVSEFSLRAPALAGGILTLVAVISLSEVMFARAEVRLLFLLLVALNPMILDYMSEARGYSLALACYLLGLLRVAPVLTGDAKDYRLRLAGAGALLGLSVAAHLSFAIPVAAFDLIFAGVSLCSLPRLTRALLWLVFAQTGVAAAITAGPLLHAERAAFAGGFSSILLTLDNFSISCLLHDWDGNGLWTYQVNTFVSNYFYPLFRWVFVLLVGIAVLFAGTRWKREGKVNLRSSGDAGFLWLLISAGTLLFSFMALVALHVFTDAPYPFARFVLYWWPLWAAIACLIIERSPKSTGPMRSLPAALVAFCLLMIVQSTLQFDLDHFGWLRYSAGTKQIAEFIRRSSEKKSGKEVTIVTSGSLFACLDYYRSIYSIKNWKLVTAAAGASPTGDYIVMDVFDRPRGAPAGYDFIWQDRLSRAVVAVPSQLVPSPAPSSPAVSR